MRGLTVDALNPAILNVQYAVRGELAIKAEEYRVRLKTGSHDLPFDKVISSNIGNPQQVGLDQPPITFNRQVGSTTTVSFWPLDALTRLTFWVSNFLLLCVFGNIVVVVVVVVGGDGAVRL